MEHCGAERELEAFLARAPAGCRLEVDLGCAKGAFVSGMAQREPGTLFVGIESQAHRVKSTGRKIVQHGCANAAVLRGECYLAMKEWFPPSSVDVVHVSFPDPWPKRRHHIRRLVNGAFLEAVFHALRPGGSLRLMTDDRPYFEAMRKAVAAFAAFEEIPWDDGRDYPATEFQARFEAEGAPIYRLALRRAAADPASRASS